MNATAIRRAEEIVATANPSTVAMARCGDDAKVVRAIEELSATAGRLRAAGDVKGADTITDTVVVWESVRLLDGRR